MEIWKSEFWCSEIAILLDYGFISMGIFVKTLPHLRCVTAFTNISVEIMHSICTKVNLKSDFHIAGQPMETCPEYLKFLAYRA
ncbi:hypothetical protein [Mediterraneibacter gnavus]|uniref:hypothetical protein n=1 Tax=Mediterraneibacter gnavus TaxID=33038 RepID=UPI0032B7E221